MIGPDTALARCQDLIQLARKMGADEADAVARASASESVGVRLGALEDVERSIPPKVNRECSQTSALRHVLHVRDQQVHGVRWSHRDGSS